MREGGRERPESAGVGEDLDQGGVCVWRGGRGVGGDWEVMLWKMVGG